MNPKMIFLSIALVGITTFSVSAAGNDGDTNKTDSQGRKQGVWVENLGPTKWQGNYVDGKKQGIWVSHHFNGVLDELVVYTNGIRNGLDINVDVNAYYKGEKTYKNDTLDGLYIEYSPGAPGKPSSEVHYKMGKYDGVRKAYYSGGGIEEQGNYINGQRNGETTWYYQDGKPATKYVYVLDKRSGPFESYYENGNKYTTGSFKDNEYDGEYYEFYEGGRAKTIGTYKAGKKTGEWKSYNEDGTELTTTHYKDDKVDGKPKVEKIKPAPDPSPSKDAKDDKSKTAAPAPTPTTPASVVPKK